MSKRSVHAMRFIAAVAIVVFSTSLVQAAKLYKWVDDKGNISYQDQPPPKDAKILSEKIVESSAPANAAEAPPNVEVYTVENCELCIEMITFLKTKNIPHIERSLQDSQDAQARILEKVDSIIAPTIFIGDQVFQGSNRKELLAMLEEAGHEIDED